MRHKFFEDTYVSKTINNILANSYLYTIPTVAYGDYIVKDCDYVYKNFVIKCNEDGNLSNNFSVIKMIDNKGYYENITHRVNPKYGFYSMETHEKLGNYLRQIRDIYELDLMPFYNCFSYRMLSNYHLVDDVQENNKHNFIIIEQPSKSSKIFLVPIKFDKPYTVAIESSTPVLIKPVLYDGQSFIKNSTNRPYEYAHDFIANSSIYKVNTNFAFPFIVNIPIKNQIYEMDGENQVQVDMASELYKYSNSLYLMIQMSAENKSSIVVLEGDYTETNARRVISDPSSVQDTETEQIYVPNSTTISNMEFNRTMISNLSLLKYNDGTCYPFADRLVEYLVRNVINNTEELFGNIEWVQNSLGYNKHSEYLGVWDNNIRERIYNFYMNDENYVPIDNNGYVDKDVENLMIQRGW